jgi:Tol biopolymer transport system component
MLANSSDGYSFKDYSSQKNGIQALQKSATPLCQNMKSISLPMLSKDGHFLAAFNAESQATEIFSIDSKSGACKFTQSLGINAGKVDFSFDGKSVTYAHIAVSSFNSNNGDTPGWMRTPNGDMVANIYTQNLKTGETRALTHFTDSNVLYPSFNAKGEIIARKFDKDGTEFLKLNPNIISSKKKKIDVSKIACENMDKSTKVALSLGAIFLKYCDQNKENWEPDGIILLGSELSAQQCWALVKKWGKEELLEDLGFLKTSLVRKNLDSRALKDISSADLAAACGK